MCQRATVYPRAKNPAIGVLASDEVPSTTHGVQNQPANARVRCPTAKNHQAITVLKTPATNLEKLQAMGMPYLNAPMKCLFVSCQLMKNFGKAAAAFVHSKDKNMASRLFPVWAINRSLRIIRLQNFIHILSIARSTFAAIWSPCRVSIVYPKSAQKICWGAESAQTTWRYWTWPLPRRTSAVLAGHVVLELW